MHCIILCVRGHNMNPQLKKGVLDVFVLAVLAKESSYGYKIVNDLKNYISISESTLYPILRRLEEQKKLITYNELFQGRNRKYYKITDKGKKQIAVFLKEWEDIKKVYDLLTEVDL